mmetsp:Transcript_3213/g.6703  ORF Transcript_3213/g.6703 Transcript_3213/m.6703 type:complete len:141 (-) Transcript_3213:53-475(-)
MDWPPQKMDFNLKGFDKYHHVIQYATPGEDKTVKLCRCWQSKRFPYCDDTHKVLIEAGDNAGPFVAKIQGKSTTSNVSATNASQARGRLPKQAAFFAMGFATVGLGIAAAREWRRGWRPSLGGAGELLGAVAGPAAAGAA